MKGPAAVIYKSLAVCASLVSLYAALGFAVLPAVLKPVVVRALTEFLGRTTTVGAIGFNPFTVRISLRSFRIDEKDGGAFFTGVSFSGTIDVWASLQQRMAVFTDAVLKEPVVSIVRDGGGTWNAADLKYVKWPTVPVFRFGNLRIEGGTVTFRDDFVPGHFTTTVGPLNAEMNDLWLKTDHMNLFAVTTASESGETLAWNGWVQRSPFASGGVVVLDNIVIPKYAPYYAATLPVVIKKGLFSANLPYLMEVAGEKRKALLQDAAFAVNEFSGAGKGKDAFQFSFKSLSLAGTRADLFARSFESATAAISGGHLALGGFPGTAAKTGKGAWLVTLGDTRLSDCAVDIGLPSGSGRVAWREVHVAKSVFRGKSGTASSGPPVASSIGASYLAGGTASFTDGSVRPPVKTSLTSIEISLGPFSSIGIGNENGSAEGSVSAVFGGTSPFQLYGTVMPFNLKAKTNFRAVLQKADLAPLSPYAEKYAGYEVKSGILALDVSFLLQKGKMTMRSLAQLDGLTFGKKTDGSSALKFSVRLAAALLKDSRGTIRLDLPFTGTGGGSRFDFRKALAHAFVSPFRKKIPAPFASIGAQGPKGGEGLDFQSFVPGSAVLGIPEKKKLDAILAGLKARPFFLLDVEGSVDAKNDSGNLARLASERAAAVKEYLVRDGALAGGRIFVIDNGLPTLRKKGSRAFLTLKDLRAE